MTSMFIIIIIIIVIIIMIIMCVYIYIYIYIIIKQQITIIIIIMIIIIIVIIIAGRRRIWGVSGIHYRGCSGRWVQWMGVVLYNKLVYDIIYISTPCFHCTPLWWILKCHETSIWLRLGRYLIVFDSLTFALDQWTHPWQMFCSSPSLTTPKIWLTVKTLMFAPHSLLLASPSPQSLREILRDARW